MTTLLQHHTKLCLDLQVLLSLWQHKITKFYLGYEKLAMAETSFCIVGLLHPPMSLLHFFDKD